MTHEQIEALPALLTTAQAADALGLCRGTIWRMAKRGDVRAVKVGQVWRLSKADLLTKFPILDD